MKETVSFWC